MIIPRLYTPETVLFDTHGLGSLSEAVDVTVRWTKNGAYELEMLYPVIGRRMSDLQQRGIIYSTVGPDEDPQPFRIYRMVQDLLGTVTVYARHVAYDLMGYTVRPFWATTLSGALLGLESMAVTEPHGFSITTELSSAVVFSVTTPGSVWSLLGGQAGSILDVCGRGEWDFNGFGLVLKERLGADYGVKIPYGVSLLELQQDVSCANVWTAVHPYWEGIDGTVVTLPEHLVPVPCDGEWGYSRTLVLDLSSEWEDAPTEDLLRARTEKYISDNDLGSPAVSLTVDWISLDQTEEYKNRPLINAVHKGDDVSIIYPTSIDATTGRPRGFVTAKARVTGTVWKPMLNRYESVNLGTIKKGLAASIAAALKNAR